MRNSEQRKIKRELRRMRRRTTVKTLRRYWKQAALFLGLIFLFYYLFTISDPGVYWAFIEAIATVVAGIAIFYELRQYKDERAARSFEAFQYAVKILEGLAETISIITSTEINDLSEKEVSEKFWEIYSELAVISEMIETGYLHKGTFLARYNNLFYAIVIAIETYEPFSEGQTNVLKFMRSSFPGSQKLLEEAFVWAVDRSIAQIPERQEESSE